jgi:hypothetical protein
VKSDFSKILRTKEAYPARTDDSTLRRMLCDREWVPPGTRIPTRAARTASMA